MPTPPLRPPWSQTTARILETRPRKMRRWTKAAERSLCLHITPKTRVDPEAFLSFLAPKSRVHGTQPLLWLPALNSGIGNCQEDLSAVSHTWASGAGVWPLICPWPLALFERWLWQLADWRHGLHGILPSVESQLPAPPLPAYRCIFGIRIWHRFRNGLMFCVFLFLSLSHNQHDCMSLAGPTARDD